jgi:hypothetical protein
MNSLKVLNHTHAIIFPVPLVKVFEIFTRILSTMVITPSPYLVTVKYFAVFMALPVRCVTSPARVPLPEKRHADGAVHAAWSYKRGPEWIFLRHRS